jgi:hypothetical protein
MATQYVDVALIEIEGPFLGAVTLRDIVSLSIGDNTPRKKVKTMTRRKVPRGYRMGTKEVTAELTSEIAISPEIDWYGIKDRDEEFTITYERAEDGIRRQLVDCIIEELSEEHNEDGESQLKISLQVLDHRGIAGTGLFI